MAACFLENLHHEAENAELAELLVEKRFAAVDVQRQIPAPQLCQQHKVLRGIEEVEHLAAFNDGQRLAEIVVGQRVDREDVHLSAAIVENLHQAGDRSDANAGQ